MFADAHGKPMSGASAHLIASSWTSANTFRRSLALNLTRMPQGGFRSSAANLPAFEPSMICRSLSNSPGDPAQLAAFYPSQRPRRC